MLVEHAGARPAIHPTATIAPHVTISGDVSIGAETAILSGAVLSAHGGPIVIGSRCVIMEQAVVRGTRRHPCTIGDNCLVGPHGYVTGATIADNVFLATGSAVFNGARIATRSEVRIHGVVHVNTVVGPDTTVPIGWVAVGDPARILPANDHEGIWEIQKGLDFPGAVFGLARAQAGESLMPEAMRRYTRALAAHRDDSIIDE